jgi:hypothetical protein
MSDRVFGQEEKAKLTQLLTEGMTVLQEVETMQGGLKDTVAAIAKELEIKASVLNKAIKVAHRGDFGDQTSDYELLESILATTGKI